MAGAQTTFVHEHDSTSALLEKLKELRDIFMQGFWDGLGDFQYRLDIIRDGLESIKNSLIDIWTDPAVQAAANNWINSVAYLLGSFAGSVASIGLTIAANLIGGLAKYLEQNKERIKGYLISMFDIWTEINNMLSELFQSIAYVFEAFASEQGQQLTANIIGIFTDAFMGVQELSWKFTRDILNILIQPFVDNKEEFRAALEGFLGVLAEVTGTIKDGIDDTFDKLNEVYDAHFKPFFDSIAQGLSDLVGQFLEFWNGSVQPILDSWARKFDALWKDHIQPAIDNIIELLGDVADFLKTVWENILQPFISWIIQNVLPAILPIVDGIVGALFDALGRISDIINSVIDIFRGIIQFLTGVFSGDWDKAWEGIKLIVSGVWNAIKSIIFGVVEAIRNLIVNFLNILKGIWSVGWNAVKTIVSSIWDGIKSVIGAAVDRVKDIIQGIINFVRNIFTGDWQSAWNTVTNIFEGVKNTISNIVNGILGFIRDLLSGISSAISGIDRLESKINGVSSRSVSSIVDIGLGNTPFRASLMPPQVEPRVPYLASGAVIPPNAPFVAMLGDQRNGNNLEAPESLIRRIVREEAGGNKTGGQYQFTAQINRRTLFDEMITEAQLRQMSTGRNPFAFE